MMFAAVDIGSNAGRLLVATVMEYKGKPVTDKVTLVRVPLRLGVDVFEKGRITPEKTEMLINTFRAYQQLMAVYTPMGFVACATSAMRDAENGLEVMELVKQETGIELKIIDGLTEAKIISEAGNTNLDKPHDYSLYIDVGGGSTEVTWFEKDTLLGTRSFQIGTIRLLYDLVKKTEWENLRHWIEELQLDSKEINCICSGGNVNKLTKMYGNKTKNTLSYAQLSEAYTILEGYSIDDRINKLGLRPDRADVIVPAAMIFKKIMKWGNIKELQAPKIGLADGLIVDLYKKYKGQETIVV